MRPTSRAAMLLVAVIGISTSLHSQTPSPRPNVVLIMTDDMGYADIGSYGAPDIKTPNIDSLARDGVRLTDFYANAMSCTPTRAGLISGRYQQRYGLELPLRTAPSPEDVQGLPVRGHSLPLLLKQQGYATALVGKWHLGYTPELSPRAHGFDYFFGHKAGAIDYYSHTIPGTAQPDLWENDGLVQLDGYITDLITRRAISFIDQHAREPFFIDVAFNAPHSPFQPPDRPGPPPASGPTRADYAAMLERVDRGVGEILDALQRHALSRNTIVIFTNDNGGVAMSHSGPLFHRKFSAWEGGIRVPALIRWPGRLPAGVSSDQVGITMDLSASILAAAQVVLPSEPKLDGINLFPILEGRSPTVSRTLFWRTAGGAGLNQRAVRSGDWKLVIDSEQAFLFDVKNDPGERHDHFARRRDIAGSLSRQLEAWEKDVDSEARRNRK